jgi:hypothetical protein
MRGMDTGSNSTVFRAFIAAPASRLHSMMALRFSQVVTDTTPMRSLRLISSRFAPRSTLSLHASSRIEVQPPSLRHAPVSRWQRALFWLLAPAPQHAAPPINRLPDVREDFLDCLVDIPPASVAGLLCQIADARSLRELWHLRAEVYNAVGRAHSQDEADRRLAQLNRHFPTRAPRSGFVPLAS